MNCPNCAAPLELTDRFCENCGTPVTAKATGTDGAASPYSAPSAPPSPYEDAPAPKHAQRETSWGEPAIPVAVPASTSSTQFPQESPAPASFDTEADASPYAKAIRDAGNPGSSSGSSASPQNAPFGQAPTASPVTPQGSYGQNTAYAPAQPAPPYASTYDPSGGRALAPGTAFVLAIVSLVLGCLGLISFGAFGFLCIVGVILGIVALVQRGKYQKQDLYDTHSSASLGLGIAGIIIAYRIKEQGPYMISILII